MIGQNVFFQYFSWHFWGMPVNILKAWKNFLRFNLNYFSVPLLLKTLFSPWRRYKVSYGRGFDVGRCLEAAFSNLIFRIIGAILRSFLIIVGILAEILILFAGVVVFISWLILPALLIAGLIFGIQIII
jgi:hypothetical protein